MASKSNEGRDSYSVRQLQKGVLETIFSSLPPEGTERKHEQDRRRKFKEKLLADHQGELIIDSSYVSSDGKEVQAYTNAIWGTKQVQWWEEKIEEYYGEQYLQKNKACKGGHQITFTGQDGVKFLSFSYYPKRNKVMAQGGHSELHSWINTFTELSEKAGCDIVNCSLAEKNSEQSGSDVLEDHQPDIAGAMEADGILPVKSPPILPEDHEADDAGVSNANVPANSPPNNRDEAKGGEEISSVDLDTTGAMEMLEGATAANVTDGITAADVTLTDTDSMLFYTPKAPELFSDKNSSSDHIPSTTGPGVTVRSKKKGLSQLRRQSGHCIIKSSLTSMRDSQRLLLIKSRLDSIDGVLAGLQGGLLQVVETVNEHREKTDDAISKLTEVSQKILEKLSDGSRRQSLDTSKQTASKEMNQLRESVCQMQNTVSKKMSGLAEQVKSLENNIQKAAEKHTQVKEDILESVQDENRKVRANVTTTIESQMKGLNRHIDRVAESVEKNNADSSKMSENIARINSNLCASVTTSSRPVTEKSVEKPSSRIELLPSSSAQENQRVTTKQRSADHRESQQNKETTIRKVLLIGDSTTRHVDKRRVLRDQTISKCKASTIAEAQYKITNGGNHIMEKIVYCLGLNDLRNGSSVREVTTDMERLLRESQRRHPGCKTYVCSILPIKCDQYMKHNIKQTNAEFSHFSTIMENVYYVDILSEFISHTSMQDLFERDQIHPNVKGTLLMTVCIKNSLHHNHTPRQQFTSKSVDTSRMTYAHLASSGPGQIATHVNNDLPQTEGVFKNSVTAGHCRPARDQNPYQSRPFPGNIWWPPGHYYPPVMPFYPPASYPQMYQPSREERQSQRINS